MEIPCINKVILSYPIHFIVSEGYLLVVGQWGGGEREVEGFLKAIIMNYRIEQKEKFEHNFLQDVMGDGQKHNDQVVAHNLCETCSG